MELPKWDACVLEPNAALRWIECHPGTAAWFGAIGVFLTILAGVITTALQRNRARRDDERRALAAKMKLLADIATLVFQIDEFLAGFPAWVQKGTQQQIPQSDTRPDKAEVLSWLLYESGFAMLDDSGMVQILADLRARMRRIAYLTNKEPPDGVVPWVYLQPNRVAAAEVALNGRADCAAFSSRYGDYLARGGPPED